MPWSWRFPLWFSWSDQPPILPFYVSLLACFLLCFCFLSSFLSFQPPFFLLPPFLPGFLVSLLPCLLPFFLTTSGAGSCTLVALFLSKHSEHPRIMQIISMRLTVAANEFSDRRPWKKNINKEQLGRKKQKAASRPRVESTRNWSCHCVLGMSVTIQ